MCGSRGERSLRQSGSDAELDSEWSSELDGELDSELDSELDNEWGSAGREMAKRLRRGTRYKVRETIHILIDALSSGASLRLPDRCADSLMVRFGRAI